MGRFLKHWGRRKLCNYGSPITRTANFIFSSHQGVLAVISLIYNSTCLVALNKAMNLSQLRWPSFTDQYAIFYGGIINTFNNADNSTFTLVTSLNEAARQESRVQLFVFLEPKENLENSLYRNDVGMELFNRASPRTAPLAHF